MEDTITIRDDVGEITISYAEMLKYHGRDFYGGVALAFKVLKLAFETLLEEKTPHRNKLFVVVGFDPPGVIDGIEYITRALTRRRLIVHPKPPKGPVSVFGRYYFEVHHERRGISLWLKSALLPEAFTPLARKAFAGTATPDETAQWKTYKHKIGRDLMAMTPEDILDTKGPFDSPIG
jgi:hypothetical protein